MGKERLGKLCPSCNSFHLMAEKWTEHHNSVKFRVTCEDLRCKYEPVHITELKENLNGNGLIAIERLDVLFSEMKGDDYAA